LKRGDKIIRNFVNKYSNRFVSRWLILIFDLIGVGVAFILAYLLRINFNFDSTYVKDLLIHGPYIIGLYFIFFLITGSYKGIIRHTSGKDVNRVMLAASLALVTNTLITILARNTELEFLPKLPHSIAKGALQKPE
jgi:FlaA1/EpsC-like NDP-sugar epimerase